MSTNRSSPASASSGESRSWLRDPRIAVFAIIVLFVVAVLLVHYVSSAYCPPLLIQPGIFKLFPAALAIVSFVIALAVPGATPPSTKTLLGIGLSAAATLVIYATTYPFLVVHSPQTNEPYQVGFATAEWSMREDAVQHMHKHPMCQSADDLMMEAAAFRPGGPSTIWLPWTIWTAGIILALLFTYSYMALSVTIALLFHHPKFQPGWMEAYKVLVSSG